MVWEWNYCYYDNYTNQLTIIITTSLSLIAEAEGMHILNK